MTESLIVLNPGDNVATALRPVDGGEEVSADRAGARVTLTARDDIPFGHKLALSAIPRDGDVVKYGESIGVAVTDIRAGEHVHTHNVTSRRGRGNPGEA
jgi:altronate dehydratase small subunit